MPAIWLATSDGEGIIVVGKFNFCDWLGNISEIIGGPHADFIAMRKLTGTLPRFLPVDYHPAGENSVELE